MATQRQATVPSKDEKKVMAAMPALVASVLVSIVTNLAFNVIANYIESKFAVAKARWLRPRYATVANYFASIELILEERIRNYYIKRHEKKHHSLVGWNW